MEGLAFAWKDRDWDGEAIALMKECVELREGIEVSDPSI
jgi:hypothetical protein